jgi:hypothetical protein
MIAAPVSGRSSRTDDSGALPPPAGRFATVVPAPAPTPLSDIDVDFDFEARPPARVCRCPVDHPARPDDALTVVPHRPRHHCHHHRPRGPTRNSHTELTGRSRKTVNSRTLTIRAETPHRRLPPLPPPHQVRHLRRCPSQLTTAMDCRPCAPSPPRAMPCHTSLFKTDTTALLPRQGHAHRPTPATAPRLDNATTALTTQQHICCIHHPSLPPTPHCCSANTVTDPPPPSQPQQC